MSHRTRGRRVPPRQPVLQEPQHTPLHNADAEEMAMTMLLAAQHYLTQRNRYLDVSECTRIEIGPQPGVITFWIELHEQQSPFALAADYTGTTDPNTFAARKLVLINDGSAEPVFAVLTAFATTSTDAEAELHQQVVQLVLVEIGMNGMAGIIGQWHAAGPWAWLDPLLTPDQPIRAWNGDGPDEPLDLDMLYRSVHARADEPRRA